MTPCLRMSRSTARARPWRLAGGQRRRKCDDAGSGARAHRGRSAEPDLRCRPSSWRQVFLRLREPERCAGRRRERDFHVDRSRQRSEEASLRAQALGRRERSGRSCSLPCRSSGARLAVNAGGTAVFVWVWNDGLGHNFIQARRLSAAGVLGPTKIIAQGLPFTGGGGAGTGNPQVGLDRDGNALIVWEQPDGQGPCGINGCPKSAVAHAFEE